LLRLGPRQSPLPVEDLLEQQPPDLAGVRDDAALARLPADEREAWQRFWADVADLRKKAEAK
jgi:hypothetical protein